MVTLMWCNSRTLYFVKKNSPPHPLSNIFKI